MNKQVDDGAKRQKLATRLTIAPVARIIAAIAVGGCAPTNLLKATAEFSKMTISATADLGAAPGLVTNICRLRAEIEFLTKRVEPGQQLTTFDAFFTSTTFPLGLPGAPTITWKQQCLAYHIADETFAKAVQSISDYGSALGGFAAETIAPGSDMKASVKSTSDGIAQLSPAVKPYKTALEGIGAPLSEIADAIATQWKAKELKKLIGKTDPPLQSAISKLEAFVNVLHDEQMRDLREALKALRDETSIRDAEQLDYVIRALEKVVSVLPGEPMRDARETLTSLVDEMKRRDKNRQKIDLLSGSMLDVSITDQLAQFEQQLAALDDALKKLGEAHAKLKAGWDQGEDMGLDTIKAVGTLAKDIYSDVKAFENPSKVGGT